jgi:peptide/nickel transport system permease protein
MVFANLGVSTPVFVLGLLLAYLFAIILKDTPFSLPPSGRLSSGVTVVPLAVVWGLEDWTGPPRQLLDFFSGIYIFSGIITGQFSAAADAFRHLILPAIALGTIPLAIIARITRSSLLEVLGLDYVRTARAKGLPEDDVLYRHALRNGLLPFVTMLGLLIPGLIGGAIIFETIFAWPGIGRLSYEAILARDYPVVIAINFVAAVLTLVGTLLSDLLYMVVDPRIRL